MSRPGYPVTVDGHESCSWQWVNDLTGQVYSESPTSTYRSMWADAVGPNSPNWPAVKPVNDFAGFRLRSRVSPALWTGTAGWPTPYLTGGGSYPFVHLLGIDPIFRDGGFAASYLESAAEPWLAQRLAKKAKDQKINIAQFFGEFKQTQSAFSNAAQRIAGGIRAVRRGQLKRAASVLLGGGRHRDMHHWRLRGARGAIKDHGPNSGSFASDWLSMQYAWGPLLSDVYGAAEELAEAVTYRQPTYRIGTRKVFKDSKKFLSISTNNFPSIEGEVSYELIASGTIDVQVTNHATDITKSVGVGNPLALAWELAPLTFVADWLYPIGTYLSTLDAYVGLGFRRGWYGYRVSGRKRYAVVGGTYQGSTNARQTWSGGSSDSEVESYRRAPLGGFPGVSLPQIKNPFSPKHAANALALIRNAFNPSGIKISQG